MVKARSRASSCNRRWRILLPVSFVMGAVLIGAYLWLRSQPEVICKEVRLDYQGGQYSLFTYIQLRRDEILRLPQYVIVLHNSATVRDIPLLTIPAVFQEADPRPKFVGVTDGIALYDTLGTKIRITLPKIEIDRARESKAYAPEIRMGGMLCEKTERDVSRSKQ